MSEKSEKFMGLFFIYSYADSKLDLLSALFALISHFLAGRGGRLDQIHEIPEIHSAYSSRRRRSLPAPLLQMQTIRMETKPNLSDSGCCARVCTNLTENRWNSCIGGRL